MSESIIKPKLEGTIEVILLLVALIWILYPIGCQDNDENPLPSNSSSLTIFRGSLAPGFDMDVNTSGGLTDWMTVDTGVIEMSYPAGQSWGVVFISVNDLTDTLRPGRNLSRFNEMVMELCGAQGNESVWIGVKDNTDPDNGREAKVRIYGIGTDWEEYVLPLSQFYTADFNSIYILIEFVFDGVAKTVYARNIEYRR